MRVKRCAFVCVAVMVGILLTISKDTLKYGFVTSGVQGDNIWMLAPGNVTNTGVNVTKPRPPRAPSDCPAVGIGPSHADNLKKIESYTFHGAEPYMSTLFARSSHPGEEHVLPVFVTAVSSSHVPEMMLFLDNINNVVRKKYPDIVLYLYDIGLTESETERIKQKCECTIRRFRFEDYPPHVKQLKGYAWKPIIVQLVAQDHPFIFWMDTSPRFFTGDLDFLFRRARKDGLLATKGFNSIVSRTHTQTFQALNEDPCAYRKVIQMQACFIVMFVSNFVRDYFLRPWVGCALSPGCMVPSGDPYAYLACGKGRNNNKFHLCHRFDQSVMNILIYRMYNRTFTDHVMKFGFYRIKRLGSNLV